MYSFCQMCGRILTDPASRKVGYGPDCQQSFQHQSGLIGAAKVAQTSGTLAYDPDNPNTSRLIVALRALARIEAAIALTLPTEYVPLHTVTALQKARRDVELYTLILVNQGVLELPQDATVREGGALAPVSHNHDILR